MASALATSEYEISTHAIRCIAQERQAALFTNANEQKRHTDKQHKSGKPLHNTRVANRFIREASPKQERQAAISTNVPQILRDLDEVFTHSEANSNES